MKLLCHCLNRKIDYIYCTFHYTVYLGLIFYFFIQLSVCVKLEDGSDYMLSLDLAHEIVPSQSKFKVLTTKVCIDFMHCRLAVIRLDWG